MQEMQEGDQGTGNRREVNVARVGSVCVFGVLGEHKEGGEEVGYRLWKASEASAGWLSGQTLGSLTQVN